VLIYLYPLKILALTYNLLSSEKEQGTMVLVLSQPISMRTLAAGKIVVRFGLFVAAVVLTSVVGLAVAGLEVGAAGILPRLGLWLSAVALYGLFWFALAALVASFGKPSATNAMILAGLWLLLVVLVPSVLSMATTTMYPVPSRVEMIQAMRVAADEANSEGSKLLAQYYEDHPELASRDEQQAMNDFNLVRVAVNDDVERRVRPVLDRYSRQLTAQHRVVERARFLSPAMLLQNALNDVAGTGLARHREFLRQVDAYHQGWRDYFLPLVFQRTRLTDYTGLPRFAFTEESLDTVSHRVGVSLAGVSIPGVVIGAVGLLRLRRYPIAG
jgi:ABC-2 type transport system permease protein